jgi:hypothetical protein
MNRQFNFEAEPLEFVRESDETAFEGFDTELADSEWQGEVNRNSRDYLRWVQHSLNQIMGLRLAEDGIVAPQLAARFAASTKARTDCDGSVGPQTERALINAGAGNPPSARLHQALCRRA